MNLQRPFLALTLLLVLALDAFAQTGAEFRAGSAVANKVWVNKTSGSDTTGTLGREDKPYATLTAAFTAAAAATGEWMCYVMPGTYNATESGTGLAPHGANYNIFTTWMPGSTWYPTTSSPLYNLSGATYGKRLWILGHGRFLGSVSQSGRFIDSTYATTNLDFVRIEADVIFGQSSGTNFVNLQGTIATRDTNFDAVTAQNGCVITVRGNMSSQNRMFFRLNGSAGTPFFQIKCSYFGSVDFEDGNYYVDCDYAEQIRVGVAAHNQPSIYLRCLYRLKGTAASALELRGGTVTVDAPYLMVTDGGAPIIKIRSDVSANSAIRVIGAHFDEWGASGTADNYPSILFDNANTNCALTLDNCKFTTGGNGVANSGTEAITTTGAQAQTILATGTLLSKLALDADITVKGATPQIDASF